MIHNSTRRCSDMGIFCAMFRAVARTLMGGGGGGYSYIHVLPDYSFFLNLNLISKETSRAEHEYMNKHPPI